MNLRKNTQSFARAMRAPLFHVRTPLQHIQGSTFREAASRIRDNDVEPKESARDLKYARAEKIQLGVMLRQTTDLGRQSSSHTRNERRLMDSCVGFF